MNKLKRYAITISVIENLDKSGSWCGETHIQKAIYFLKKLFPEVIDYSFILYKHGPFSFDLRDDIGIMAAGGFLKIVPMFPYGPRILPGKLADKVKGLFPKTLEKCKEKIEFVTHKFKDKWVADLEALATGLYITTELMPSGSVEKRAEKLCQLKPHIPFWKAKEAVKEVDKIIEEAKKLTI